MATEVSANSWTCRQADLTRQVTIYYPAAPAPLPCEVFYAKPDEAVMPRALWRAQNQQGYCQRQAEAFIEKLATLGWHCSLDEAESSASSFRRKPESR